MATWTLLLATILIVSMPFHTLPARPAGWHGDEKMVFNNKIEMEKKGSISVLIGGRTRMIPTSARMVPTGSDPIHHNQAPTTSTLFP